MTFGTTPYGSVPYGGEITTVPAVFATMPHIKTAFAVLAPALLYLAALQQPSAYLAIKLQPTDFEVSKQPDNKATRIQPGDDEAVEIQQ